MAPRVVVDPPWCTVSSFFLVVIYSWDDVAFSPKTGKARSARSGSAIGDSILAALTDSTYLEELQEKIEKESIASLHERLAERKVCS